MSLIFSRRPQPRATQERHNNHEEVRSGQMQRKLLQIRRDSNRRPDFEIGFRGHSLAGFSSQRGGL
jgi:hypothetical protein